MPRGVYKRTKGLKRRGFKHSEETKKKMSETHKGKKLSKEHRENIIKALIGRKVSPETRKKIGDANRGRKWSAKHRAKISGKNSSNWKGGITSKNRIIRHNVEFRLWREAVFTRDNWTCQKCLSNNGNGKTIYLHPHHIQNFAQYPELRFAIDNGITLCKECHMEFHNIYKRRNNTEEQIEKFLLDV